MTIYNITFTMEVDEVDNMDTHEDAYSRHLAPSFKQKEFKKSFNLDIPISSVKGIEAVTDILIDEYHETETFIKELFNSNSMEAL